MREARRVMASVEYRAAFCRSVCESVDAALKYIVSMGVVLPSTPIIRK